MSSMCSELIVHRLDNRDVPLGHGRSLAPHIPNAPLVELGGLDHLPFVGDADDVRPARESDRMLTTILFGFRGLRAARAGRSCRPALDRGWLVRPTSGRTRGPGC